MTNASEIEEIADCWSDPVGSEDPERDEIISDLTDAEILISEYEGGYDGVAFVLYRKNGKLFEVNGSHCSCFGLEGQWAPEETSFGVLLNRNFYGLGNVEFQIEKLAKGSE